MLPVHAQARTREAQGVDPLNPVGVRAGGADIKIETASPADTLGDYRVPLHSIVNHTRHIRQHAQLVIELNHVPHFDIFTAAQHAISLHRAVSSTEMHACIAIVVNAYEPKRSCTHLVFITNPIKGTNSDCQSPPPNSFNNMRLRRFQ